MEIVSDNSRLSTYISSLQFENTLFYTSPEFLDLVGEYLGAQKHCVIWRNQRGKVEGALPFLVKDGELGPVLNSLPYYGSNGGPIVASDNCEAQGDLVEAYLDFSQDLGAVSASIVTNPLDPMSTKLFSNSRFSHQTVRIGQVSRIDLDDQGLLGSFLDPRPRNIRKALAMGVTVRASNALEDLRFLWSTHAKNMQVIGGLAKDWEFFMRVPHAICERNWRVFIAELDEKPIAALLVLANDTIVEYFTPAIVQEYRPSQALSLVIYEAMMLMRDEGRKLWNWGGTWPSQKGVYEFKNRWGSMDFEYRTLTAVLNPEVYSCTPDFIAKNYKGFFVVPFDRLVGETELR